MPEPRTDFRGDGDLVFDTVPRAETRKCLERVLWLAIGVLREASRIVCVDAGCPFPGGDLRSGVNG